jgi:hypothetical protein
MTDEMRIFMERAKFFSALADLIPARHYYGEDEERVQLRYIEKSKRDDARKDFQKKYKAAKRAKFDPDAMKSRSDTGRGAQQQDRRAYLDLKTREESPETKDAADKTVTGTSPDNLREKLQLRLDELRKQRKADEHGKKVRRAKEWKEAALHQGRKKVSDHQKQVRQKLSKAVIQGNIVKKDAEKNHDEKKKESKVSEFAFSKLRFGESGQERKKQKFSKQEMLQRAEEQGRVILSKEEEKKKAWKAALARAHGEKVLDDPKLLRKSLKKEVKLKDKKAKIWADRQEQVKEKQSSKQQKRKENLQARIDAKKAAKKERREKKLLRAGFEGRKKSFIPTPTK